MEDHTEAPSFSFVWVRCLARATCTATQVVATTRGKVGGAGKDPMDGISIKTRATIAPPRMVEKADMGGTTITHRI